MKYLLPGMGATSEMYGGPWRSLENSHAIDWPEYRGEKSVGEVAERLIDKHGIRSEDIVVGSSLGGIVALEIHRRVRTRHVILIGSAVAKDEINAFLLASIPLAEVVPMRMIQHIAGMGFDEVSSMFAKADGEFVRAMCAGVGKWRGYDGSLQDVSRIHGDRDAVIQCPKNAHVIAGGGHLIAMTHAEECIEIMSALLIMEDSGVRLKRRLG